MLKINQLNRRAIMKLAAVSMAQLWLLGCGEDPIQVQVENPKDGPPNASDSESPTTEVAMEDGAKADSFDARATAWETQGLHTPAKPGEWVDKIVGHYPVARVHNDVIDVRVYHPMDADHFIQAIYLRNVKGQIIEYAEFDSTANSAEATFKVTDHPDELTAFAVCNLHQVWQAPVVRTERTPGPWSAKIHGHTPRVRIDGEEAIVSVPHAMTPDYYIVGLYLFDQDDVLLSKVQLTPNDPPTVSVLVGATVTHLTAMALCDDHDLWEGPTLVRYDHERVQTWEAAGVLTANDYGEWGDKIVGHYPIVTANHQSISVHTPHAMDDDHYIEAIYLKDADGHLIGLKTFMPGDWPAAVFDVNDSTGEYMAYSVCNLHQVWKAPITRNEMRPGPWAEKVGGHTPTLEVSADRQTVTVSVPHVMDDDHRIVGLYISDDRGVFVGKIQLDPEAVDLPKYSFTLRSTSSTVTPWALCDDHDLWMGTEVSIQA